MSVGSQTLVRGLRLLELIAEGNDGVSVRDLAAKAKLPASIVHRLLSALESEGYIAKHPSTVGYRLTLKLWRLGSAASQTLALKDASRPHLKWLAEQTDETAKISVLDGQDVLTMDMIECAQPVRAYVPLGGAIPAPVAASGRAIIAFAEDERFLEDPELAAELQGIRARGYAVNQGDWQQGVGGVAAPIFIGDGKVVASIGLVLPLVRLSPTRTRHLGLLCTEAAERVSTELGYGEITSYFRAVRGGE